MKKLLIISILLSPFCILNYSKPYQNGRQESGWQVISSGKTNELQSIHFAYTGVGYTCGNSGAILKSIDEGITWNQVTVPTSVNLYDIFVFDQNFALAVGDSGIILRTTGGRETATPFDIKNSPVNDFKFFQNYPTPFNPSTKIKFTLPQDERRETQDVCLIVYDVLGNEVAALVNKEKPAGEYEVEFSAIGGSASGGNAYTIPSGVYFYQLKAGNLIETKKMILMK